MIEVKILNYRKIEEGLVKALVDIEVNDWTLKALRVTQHPGRRPYVASSRAGIKDPGTGHLTFEQIIYAPPDIWAEIENKIIKRYEEENGKNGNTTETN